MPVFDSIIILGPTAGGKSDLAVSLALSLGNSGTPAEVIGADSMQVYRHLDAGTAKPDRTMRQRVRHHLIDLVEPTQRFTVHDWLQHAAVVIRGLQDRGGIPIVVGGTHLYLKALLEGMFDGPGQDEAFRRSLQSIETAVLHQRLAIVDPEAATRIKPADRQRIVRALEVYDLTGRPISDWQTQWTQTGQEPTHPPLLKRPLLLGLRWPPEAINPRINLRVKAMFYPEKVEPQLARAVCINGESLIDEVRRLRAQGAFEPLGQAVPNQAREALGYKQLLAYLEGTDPSIGSFEKTFEQTKVLTRRFAKQQRTWLKRFSAVHWIAADDRPIAAVRQDAMTIWAEQRG
ncbi:MAG: tRNA (adenosine(37)-N6)-dimethylallyltransferase MiaA [Planctomycetota bacterium]